MSNDDRPYFPKTSQQAIVHFANEQNAFEFAVSLRWPDGVFCPFCNSAEHSFISTRKIWKCKGCKKQFSVRVGTIFEDSPIILSKWFVAIWMLANCKNGVSSYELHRAIGVTQKTAWFMLHRIRAAIKAKSFDRKLSGTVEEDETYVGGMLKNMHKSRRAARGLTKGGKLNAGPFAGKTLVTAVVDRKGEVRTKVIADLDVDIRRAFIREHVEKGSELMTDMGGSRFTSFVHQCFRYNNRKATDGQRFVRALAIVPTARLTYADLIRTSAE